MSQARSHKSVGFARAWVGPLATGLLCGFMAMTHAAPIGASVDSPAARADPVQGGQVLDRALSPDLTAVGRQQDLPLHLRREDPQTGARAVPSTVPTAGLPSGARVAPTAPAPQAPAVLQGQLPGTANATAARPETPPLARDWASTGSGQGLGSVLSGAGSGGSRAGPAQGSAGPAPSFAPLVWLSQGLAFVREHRISLLAGVGGLVLLMLLQQVRGRRRA